MIDVRRNHRDLGASAVEYALIVFAIAATAAFAIFGLSRVVVATHQDACTQIDGAINGGDCAPED